jgi:hypothetical protein
LGENYPNRIVDIVETRKKVLKELFGKRKDTLTIKEKQRILKVHILKNRIA